MNNRRLTLIVSVVFAFLAGPQANAVEDNNCSLWPSDSLRHHFNSNPQDTAIDALFDAYVLPDLSRDVQAVWRSHRHRGISVEEALSDHLETFYSDYTETERKSLRSSVAKTPDRLERLAEHIREFEYTALDRDVIYQSILENPGFDRDSAVRRRFSDYFLAALERYAGEADRSWALARAYQDTINERDRQRGVAPNRIVTAGNCYTRAVLLTERALRREQMIAKYPLDDAQIAEMEHNLRESLLDMDLRKNQIDHSMNNFHKRIDKATIVDFYLSSIGNKYLYYESIIYRWSHEMPHQ